MEKFPHKKKFKAFNWNDSHNDQMNLVKIKFSCKVHIPPNWAVYLNDAKWDEERENRSNISYVSQGNKTENVALTFEKGILPTSGGHPENDIWIEFESSEDIVEIKDLSWAVRKGESETIIKKADKNHLKAFNKMLETFPKED